MAKTRKRIMAVGFGPAMMDQLGEICKDFEVIQVGGIEQLSRVMSDDVSKTVDLIAVSTADSDTTTHLEEIDSIRTKIVKRDIPILSAISRYQPDLGKELDQLDGTAWVYQPLDKKELRGTLEALNV